MIETRTGTGNSLLQAREEALRSAEMRSLRPLGKLWGMDVFSWYAPSVYEVSATIGAFPFPVLWLGNEALVNELAQVDPQAMKQLEWCAQYDSAALRIPGDVMASMPLVTATETLDEALVFLRHLERKKRIVLFTVSGNEWKTRMADFESFVKLHGTK
jgi:hypothetical protein